MTALTPAAREAASLSKRAEALEALIASLEPARAYAIFDGATVAGFPAVLTGSEHAPLMSGTLGPDLREVSPYIVAVAPDGVAVELVAKWWDKPWGILAFSDAAFPLVHRHFRALFTVHDESGKPMLFRFYDPRVLPVFLEASTDSEVEGVFGPASLLCLTAADVEFTRLSRR